ncbi:MAG: Crp/Fnr family transcriptional regulator [Bacteroidia bacterium]
MSHRFKEIFQTIFEQELMEEILSVSRIENFKEGDTIIEYGKTIRYIPLIIEGTLKVFTKDNEGREILLYYLSSSESCAMAFTCCMEHKKSEIRAIAEEDVTLLMIPNNKIDEWITKYPSWKSYIFGSFTNRFNELLNTIESVAFQKLDERLVKYLQEKQKITGKSTLHLSHQQIAEELGTNRVVISRLLKQLENSGQIILYRNEIKLLSKFHETVN